MFWRVERKKINKYTARVTSELDRTPFCNRSGKQFGSPCFNILNPKLALQNEWSSHQVCWLTNLFWHWFLCAPALRWFVSVGREWVRLIELATHRAPNSWRWGDIFYSRCQREADAFHLQWDKFLERALFFIYIAAYLCQCSLVSPSCTQTLWDKTFAAMCRGRGAATRWTGHQQWEWRRVIRKQSERLSTCEDNACKFCGKVRGNQ